MIKIKALGKFHLSDGTNVLDDDSLRSDMLKKLMIYMLMHRDHPVTTQELLEALWEEDETDNPMGALKNLMYRLRTTLKANFGDAKFIITGSKAYRWNTEIEVELDIEEFEKYIKLARLEKNESSAIAYYERALSLYQGDFMDNVLDKHWAVIVTTHYHSLFLSSVKELSDLYLHFEQYHEMERICMNGLKFDRVDEHLHCNYILSLIRQNKLELAVKSFEDASRILYEVLGVQNSDKLLEVQEELLKMNIGDEEESMENIYEDMSEGGNPVGVFMCGYPVFREIYRLEARKIERLGQTEFVGLITMEFIQDMVFDNNKMKQFILKQAMKHLEESLKETLRIGDVGARYSDRQFVILLLTCTYENSVRITERIRSKFYEKHRGRKVNIKFEFQQVMAEKCKSPASMSFC